MYSQARPALVIQTEALVIQTEALVIQTEAINCSTQTQTQTKPRLGSEMALTSHVVRRSVVRSVVRHVFVLDLYFDPDQDLGLTMTLP